MAKKSLTDMAADAAEDWRNEERQREGREIPLSHRLAFAIGYLRGFRMGQQSKPIGRKS